MDQIAEMDKDQLREELREAVAAIKEIYEVWAGSDGFVPETAPEAYQMRLIDQMKDIARDYLTL